MDLQVVDIKIQVEDPAWKRWTETDFSRRAYGDGTRPKRHRTETYAAHERRLNAKPRIYIDVKGESIWDNLAERRVRPVDAFRVVAKQALELEAVKYERINWWKNAGCTMCPCSPGFLVTGAMRGGWDMWVTVEGYEPQSDADRANIAYKVQNLQALVQGVDL